MIQGHLCCAQTGEIVSLIEGHFSIAKETHLKRFRSKLLVFIAAGESALVKPRGAASKAEAESGQPDVFANRCKVCREDVCPMKCLVMHGAVTIAWAF